MLLPQDQGSWVPLSPTPSGEPTTSPENAPPDSRAVAEGPANMTSASKYNSRFESHMPTTSEKQFKCKTKALPSKSLCGFSVNVHHMSAVYRGEVPALGITHVADTPASRGKVWGALTRRGPGSCTSCPAGQSRRGGEPTEPEAQGPMVPPGQRAPATSDHLPRAGGQRKSQNRCADSPALRRSLGPTSSPPVYLHVPTHLHIHTHACGHTHTPQPRCGPEDDRLSSKLLGFVWEFRVGQGAGDWGKDT